jgi:hypothetical protein
MEFLIGVVVGFVLGYGVPCRAIAERVHAGRDI